MDQPQVQRELVTVAGAARLYAAFATLITTVLTTQYLGPSGRGVLVAAIAWTTLFATLGHLSLSQVVVHLAAGKDDEDWLPEVLAGLSVILVGVGAVGCGLAVSLYLVSGGSLFQHIELSTFILALLAFPLMIWIESSNGVLLAMGKLRLFAGTQVINGTALVLFTFSAVAVLQGGVNGAITAVVVSHALTAAIVLWLLTTYAGRARFDRRTVSTLLRGSAKLHFNAIGTYLFAQSNLLILNHYRSENETAWFQLALQLVAAMQLGAVAVSTVTYTLVSKLGADAAWPHQRRLLVEALAVIAALSAAAFVLAPPLIPRVFGLSFAPAVPVFQTLLFAVFGMTFSTVMASQWIGRGLFVQASLLTLGTGILSVIGNYVAVPRWGMLGAAWVTNGVYLTSILANGAMAYWVNARWRRLSAAYA